MNGEVISFHGGKLDFTPLRADIPIYVASNNRLGLQGAGELADGAIMQGCVAESTVRFFREQVGTGLARASRSSGDCEMVARINVCISDDRRAALDALKPGIAVSLIAQQPKFWSFEQAGLDIPPEIRSLVEGRHYSHDPAVIAPVAKHIPDGWVDALTIAGDPDHVAEEVNRLVDRGMGHFMLFPVPVVGGQPIHVVRRFAREVLPQVPTRTLPSL